MAKRTSSGEVEHGPKEGETDPGLTQAAEDLIQAIHAKDAAAVVSAFKAAMALASEPEAQEQAE